MPFPMIHLAIANRIGERKGEPPIPAFLLGSIAPDAIHMRENSDRAAKNGTHLFLRDEELDQRLDELWQKAISPGFTAGYIAHILTDRLWLDSIMKPLWTRLDPLEYDEKHRLYYQEADQVDFNLYHYAAWRADTWTRLAQATAPNFEPLLQAQEISQWQDRTIRWFEELKEEPKIQPLYWTDDVVGEFIEAATTHVDDQLCARCGPDYW